MKSYKDLLVQYQGGGYDGCFWEWNFFLFDKDGKFHNLFTSGYAGIKTEKQGQEMASLEQKASRQNLKNHEFYLDNNNKYCSNDIYIYNLNNANDIDDFQSDNSSILVTMICDAVNTIYHETDFPNDEIMYYQCSYCERKVYPMNNDNYPSYFHDEHAYYGHSQNNDTMLCEECYLNRCDKCEIIINMYDEKEKTFVIKKKSKWGIDEQYVCKDCYDDSCNAILEGEKPCVMHIPYDKNQVNMFKEYSNTEKQISKYIDDDNEQEIKDYLKEQGFDIE